MYEVTIKSGKKLVARQVFDSEEKAFEFYESYRDKYTCEFKNLSFYKTLH
jgi:hypothetical protein